MDVKFMNAKAHCDGNRKVRAFYLLKDIIENEEFPVEHRIHAQLLTAKIYITASFNKTVTERIDAARRLIEENAHELGDDRVYWEIMCTHTEMQQNFKLLYDYKCSRQCDEIIKESLKQCELSNPNPTDMIDAYNERYYELIFSCFYIKCLFPT